MKKVAKSIKLNKLHIERAIRDNRHLYFGVEFTKKDGSTRVMSAKLGVRKGLKGGVNKVVKPNNSYMTVYDNNARGFRTVNLDTIKKLHIQGREYVVS